MSYEDHARFWSYVNVGQSDECWLWRGAAIGKGYGAFSLYGKQRYVHQIAYVLSGGYIPPGQQVMHTCHSKLCCNPRHLRAVVAQQNLAHNGYSGRRRIDNSSGLPGVRLHKGHWQARKTEFGIEITLYHGRDFFEACCARKSWEARKLQILFQE